MTDKEWEEKCNLYIKIHDAVVRDNEKLYIENMRLKEAVAAEREACAKVCDDIYIECECEDVLVTWCATAIRARGNT